MANSTVCQSKWKPIVEPQRAKPKTYRQAHWLKFYEEVVIVSEARTAKVATSKNSIMKSGINTCKLLKIRLNLGAYISLFLIYIIGEHIA